MPSGKGSGGFLPCLHCCRGRNLDEKLPQQCFDQDEELIFYRIEFALDNMDQSWWSIGVRDKLYLTVRTVVQPPDIWIGHIKLRDILEDDEVTVDFENQYRKVTIILQKPDLYSWNSVGTFLPDHNTIAPSTGATPDFYPGSIVLKEQLDSHHYLFAIYTGGDYLFGVPPGWNMIIKIDEVERRYTPVRLLTLNQIHEYRHVDRHRTVGQVTFFIIRIYETGTLTSKLVQLPLNKHGSLQIGGIQGKFDTAWLANTDRLVIIAGGSGVAPFTAIIKFLHDHDTRLNVKQVIFIYSFRANKFNRVPWHDAWETLATYDWFFYIPYITTGKGGDGSRFTFESIKEDLEQIPLDKGKSADDPTFKERAMACGPHGFCDYCSQIYNRLGIAETDTYLFYG